MFKIVVKTGPKKGSVCLLGKERVTIGRDPSNTIALADRRISRVHCSIAPSGHGYCLEDLQSVNGTQVNGNEIQKCELKPGDKISLGSTVLDFLSQEASDKEDGALSDSHVELLPEGQGSTGAVVECRLPVKDKAETFRDFSKTDGAAVPKIYQRLLTLYDVSSKLGVVTDIDLLLLKILDLVLDIMGADRGFIMLSNEDATELTPRAARRRGSDASPEMAVSRSIVFHVLKTGESVLTSDAQHDSRFSGAESIIIQGIRSAMCVPLRSKDKILGILHVDTNATKVRFNQDDLELTSAIASQAAMAIENAMLFDSLKKANQEIRDRQEQLIESEKLSALGRLAAGVAHEINNPMTSILGYSQLSEKMLSKESMDPASIRECFEFIKIVESEAIRCQSIVQTLLQFGRKKEQKMSLVDINQVVEASLVIAKFHIKRSSIEIQKDLAGGLPKTTADQHQLQQVFLNMIINARDAMENSGGILRISTRAQEGWISVKFADTGCGIPPDKIDEIFKPLYTTKGEGKGTGLGLSVTQDIIEAHQGAIDVESEVGKGTMFTIRLPVR